MTREGQKRSTLEEEEAQGLDIGKRRLNKEDVEGLRG